MYKKGKQTKKQKKKEEKSIILFSKGLFKNIRNS
jgi:hypothetical protein